MKKQLMHARISETGSIWGQPGDQTGHEVEISDWDDNWTKIFRFKSRVDADKAAKLVQAICNNDNVGYSQNNGQSPRTSLLTELEKHNWDVSKIGKCNCDCSSLIMTVCRYLGYNVSKDMWTGTEESQLMNTGKFSLYAYPTTVLDGDIMWRTGHTAMALVTDDYDYITTGNLWLRQNAGTDSAPITVIPINSKVNRLSNPWVQVSYEEDGKIYTGWCSSLYLEEL